MRLLAILFACALAGCATQTTGPTGTEILLGPTLSGWIVVDRIPGPDGPTARYLKYGQTPEGWTEMVTATTTPRPADLSFEDFVKRVAIQDEATCAIPGRYSLPTTLTSDYPSVLFEVSCGRTKADGLGRITMLRLIEGNDAFYQVRHIWKLPAAAESSALTMTKWMNHDGLGSMASVRVCDNGRLSRKC